MLCEIGLCQIINNTFNITFSQYNAQKTIFPPVNINQPLHNIKSTPIKYN